MSSAEAFFKDDIEIVFNLSSAVSRLYHIGSENNGDILQKLQDKNTFENAKAELLRKSQLIFDKNDYNDPFKLIQILSVKLEFFEHTINKVSSLCDSINPSLGTIVKTLFTLLKNIIQESIEAACDLQSMIQIAQKELKIAEVDVARLTAQNIKLLEISDSLNTVSDSLKFL